MRKNRWLAGILALMLLMSGCVPSGSPLPVDGSTGEESTCADTTENTIVSTTEDTTEDTTDEITKPVTEGTTAEEPFAVAAPPEGTPGVFFADSFAALCEIVASDVFVSYEARPTICITEAFFFEMPLEIARDTDLIYLPSECAGGNTVTVRCPAGTDSIRIATATEMLIEGGIWVVDAPSADLTLVGDILPAMSSIELYCNVASCNGEALLGEYGGHGTSHLETAVLYQSETGKPYDGVSVSVTGNLAVVSFPLIVSEKDVRSAQISFTADDGSVIACQTMDLTEVNRVTVTDKNGQTRTYMLTSERLSYLLPVMEIHTDGGAAIVEKNTYIHGVLTIDGEAYPMKIRGRGNASWNQFPKKSYRIKLDDGAPVFGLPENRDWVLTSNYADKTMIRNCVAHSLAASLSGLDYTATHVPVNLYLNGKYIGVYTFGDKIEDGNGRLSLGGTVNEETGKVDVGFLLEIGWDFDEENVYNQDYFDTDHVKRIFVKEPEIEKPNTQEFLYIKNYILQTERAIVSNNGWEAYIDVDSWIDWFIVNELTFNTESSFYRSCYLYRESGGKLKLGPVWDFDMAFGNHYGDLAGYDGWCTTESTYFYLTDNWMKYLMKSPAFTEQLVKRWNEVKDNLLETAITSVDYYSVLLNGSQQQNFLIWNIMNTAVGMGSVNYRVYNTYEKQVQYLREFILSRWNYIDTRLNSGEYPLP